MAGLITWVSLHSSMILAAMLVASEALALIPGVQANSLFQLVSGWLKSQKPPVA